ncbi:MAG TPA: S8 family peptidase [Rubrobacter sp.]|nr:S8 family peptidase [Rubrobacter sp.]
MSSAHRLSLLAGTLAALVFLFIFVESSVQVARTQASPEDPTYQEGARRQFAPGEIIVTLDQSASQSDLTQLNQQNDASTEEDLPQSKVNVVDLPPDLTVSEGIQAYENSPDVAYAEPNFKLYPTATPNDPLFSRMWALNNTGQTGGTIDADIDAPEQWNTNTGSPLTVVAVIDEGMDINHPDLKANIYTNTVEANGDKGVDDDRNGYVDDVHGFDFANNDASVYDPDPLTGKGEEHGTHVAGTIAAVGNNGAGVTGVNWQAKIMPLKFLGPNGGYTSDAVEALDYAVKNGVKISNNSWGGGGKSQALQDAIARADSAGHLFVTAAGNGGADGIGDNNDVTPNYPANYPNSNIISVAATDSRDRLAAFSNFGVNTVDLAAPGVSILSTLPGNTYGNYSGTSMATPHVTGVAALIKSQNPTADDGAMKAQILQFAEKKPSLKNKVATGGRLNAYATLTQQVAADTTDPQITNVRPVPGSKTRDRTPAIKATVKDNRSELMKSDIHLFVDGKERTSFSYDQVGDRLSYTSTRLSYARHTVKIVADDEAGNTAIQSWRFTVRR